MKVAMVSRSTLFSVPGGDTVQMVNTAKFLKEYNIDAQVFTANEKINYQQYDLLHFFNIIRPADILGHLKKSNLPYVLSPIFVDYSEYEKKARSGIAGIISKLLNANQQEYVKTIARRLLNGEPLGDVSYLFKGHGRSIQKILTGASVLLPNSINENKRLYQAYGIEKKFKVVPNAIDERLFTGTGQKKDEKQVLCVSRIEGRKNQLNLIRALNGTDFHLLIIGAPAPNHKSYYEQCKKEAESNIEFLPSMNQNELAAFYALAKVHVLPSWFETTGLSSLEAAAMDCNIVVTHKGDTGEYFGQDAFYCEPQDVLSIRNAVEKAASSPVSGKLKEKILSSFTWHHAAKQTKMAYEEVLNTKH